MPPKARTLLLHFDDLVSKPKLKSQFVLLEELAVVSNELEHPLDHRTIAFDEN